MRDAVLVRSSPKPPVPMELVESQQFSEWLARQPAAVGRWVQATGFEARAGQSCLVAAADGQLERVILGLGSGNGSEPASLEDRLFAAFATSVLALPQGFYALSGSETGGLAAPLEPRQHARAALGWGLGAYRFRRYLGKSGGKARSLPQLVLPEGCDGAAVQRAVAATAMVRDLVNTPAGDLGPAALAREARRLGRSHGARVSVLSGTSLLRHGYPAIHAVGRAAAEAPRLIDMIWEGKSRGRRRLPRITLCGKGVCFDTGGLDMKSSANMKLMKKDMAGAAQALGLARMIMEAGLPLRLRVLIPAVENAISGQAYHPLDILDTRAGLTVEVGNTDAEGRIILADALAEASRESPDLLIDFATLTGAARVALGTGLPALFCNDDSLAEAALKAGEAEGDPLWRLPLWQPYRPQITSRIADLCNISEGPFGGAITAALFLEAFVKPTIPWIHLDFMGWNLSASPGHPQGGEAQGMRALFHLIKARLEASKDRTEDRAEAASGPGARLSPSRRSRKPARRPAASRAGSAREG